MIGCAAAPLRGQTRQTLRLVTPEGHTDRVNAAAFSPDGRWVVTASADNTARVWEVATGREVVLLRGHTKGVTAVAFSSDEARVVTASLDGTTRVWEVATGQEDTVFRGPIRKVGSAALSADGRWIVAAGDDSTRVWETATGKVVAVLGGHASRVNSAAFSPDGEHAVTAGSDSTARVWDVAAQRSAVIQEHDQVTFAALSPDGRRVVTAVGKIARVWNVETRRPVAVFLRHRAWVNSAAFSPDGRFVVTASNDSTAQVWLAATGQQMAILHGHTAAVKSAAFSVDGRWVVTASIDHTARVWEASRGWDAKGWTVEVLSGHANWVNSVALSPDGRLWGTANGDKTARVWETATGREVVLRGHMAGVNSVAFSPDGGKVVTASMDNTARVWEATTGKQLAVLRGHTAWVNSAAFSSDGQRVVTASGDRTTRVWEAVTGRELKVLRAPGNGVVMSAAFSTYDQWVVTASLDGAARVWDVMKGRVVAVLDAHSGVVNSAAFSPDGRWVVTAGGDNRARVWDVGKDSVVAVFGGHTAEVKAAAFAPDGARVVTASLDGTARVWEAATGQEDTVFRGSSNGVGSAAFSRDGQLVVTGGDDSARLWDVRTGAELLRRFNVDSSEWAVVAPDGRFDGSDAGYKRLYYSFGLHPIDLDAFFQKFFKYDLIGDLLSGAPYTGPDLRRGFGLPPAVRIVFPHPGETVSSTVTVVVEARDQGGGMEDIQIFDNGALVSGTARSGVVGEKCAEGKTADSTTAVCRTVDLLPGPNVLEATAYSSKRVAAERARVTVNVPGGPAPRGTLYLLAVGINHYQNSSYNLQFARADAAAFADSVRLGGQRIFDSVKVIPLFDSAATGLAIKAAFRRIAKSAKLWDTFVFFFAGHGTIAGDDTARFYLVPSEVTNMSDLSQLAQHALSSAELIELFQAPQARKKLMLMDACQSGAMVQAYASRGLAEVQAMALLARASAVFIVAASEKDQSAQEVGTLAHGVFTYALLQAMATPSPKPRPRMVGGIVSEVELIIGDLSRQNRRPVQFVPVHREGDGDWPLIVR